MQIIREELDLSNIFKKLHKDDNIINMSYKSKKNLEKLKNSLVIV